MIATIDDYRRDERRSTKQTRRSEDDLTADRRSAIRISLEQLVDSFERRRSERIAEEGAVLTAAYDAGIKPAVHEALHELAAGCYGLCIECHEPIPFSRLRDVPYARRCGRCQRAEENRWNDVEHLFAGFIRQWVGEPQGPTRSVSRHAA